MLLINYIVAAFVVLFLFRLGTWVVENIAAMFRVSVKEGAGLLRK